jgi:hypothetical protein
MNPRAVLLIGAMLVSPAWSQEPSFDLKSDAIKRIVQTTAATQYAPIQPPEEKPVEPEPASTIKFVPPVKEEPPVKRTAKPAAPAPQSHTFLSALVETLVDDALGTDEDLPDEKVDCPWPDDLMSANHYEACRRRP